MNKQALVQQSEVEVRGAHPPLPPPRTAPAHSAQPEREVVERMEREVAKHESLVPAGIPLARRPGPTSRRRAEGVPTTTPCGRREAGGRSQEAGRRAIGPLPNMAGRNPTEVHFGVGPCLIAGVSSQFSQKQFLCVCGQPRTHPCV